MVPPIGCELTPTSYSTENYLDFQQGVCSIPPPNPSSPQISYAQQVTPGSVQVNPFRTCESILQDHLPCRTRPSAIPLARFNVQNDYQRCIAQRLNALLEHLHFEEANATVNPSHGVLTVYEDDPASAARRLTSTHLTYIQWNMVGFFMYGLSLSEDQIQEIFRNQSGLFDQLMGLGIVVSETRDGGRFYRLNNLNLESHRLPNSRNMYLFSELPSAFKRDHASSTSMISTTSFILLYRIEQSYAQGNLNGVIADMGSGNGIQAIALLMMNPGVEEAIATEVDEAGMNLSRFNAMMNGVENRYTVIDNSDASFDNPRRLQSFDRALRGRRLSLAVSNPPFNIVPRSVSRQFPSFGAGGEQGLDITRLFLWQILPHLDSNAEFLFYSQLAEDPQGQFFLERGFNRQGRHAQGFQVNIERANFEIYNYNAAEYSEIMEQILGHFPNPQGLPIPSRSQILEDLRRAQVAALRPAYVSIRPQSQRDTASQVSFSQAHLSLLELSFMRPIRPVQTIFSPPEEDSRGGIYIYENLQSNPSSQRGGAFIERHEVPRRGGVYETIHQIPEAPRGRLPNHDRLMEDLFRRLENLSPEEHRNLTPERLEELLRATLSRRQQPRPTAPVQR